MVPKDNLLTRNLGDSTLLDWAIDQTERVGPQLLHLLRRQIISGALRPGTRLSESDVAAKCSVSRQPVREAFIKLAEEGLLEVRPQRGSFVPKISLKAVNDARFIREAIEADIVKQLAKAPDKVLIKELHQQIDAQEKVLTEPFKFIELDDLFHSTLAEGAERAYAWQVISGLKAQLDRVRHISIRRFSVASLVNQHRTIVNEIEAGSVRKAKAALRAHLSVATTELPTIAAENPDFFEIEDT